MGLFKYFKGRIRYVLAIVVLLAAQASCDLALPNYTSDIVDVGIGQSGVESALPVEMREGTMDAVLMLSSPDDRDLIEEAYSKQGDNYVLNQAGEENAGQLEEALKYPLVMCYYAGQSDEMDIDQAVSAYKAGMIDDTQVDAIMVQATEQLDKMGDSIVSQQAVAAVKAEYEACGIDMEKMQRDYLLSVGARMLGVTLLGVLCAAAVSFLASRTGSGIARDLRKRLFEKVVGFSDAEVQKFSAASLITRSTNDIQQIQMVTIMLLRMVLFAPIMATGGIILILRTNTQMSWIIVLAVALVVCLVMLLMVLALPKFKIMQTLIDRVNLVAREVLTGLPVIRAFNRQQYEEERFDKASLKLKGTQLFTNRVMSFMFPGMTLIMNGVSVLIVWVASGYIDNGTIQTGDMIAFITYSMFIIMSFLMMSMVAVFLPRAQVSAKRIDEVLATQCSIADPDQPADAEVGGGEGVEIVFDQVDFAYSDFSKKVLEDVSFTAKAGKTTAIIGATGSGKSTVLRLLMRAYDVTGGKVTVDGVDVRDLSQKRLHSLLGYVPQKAFLFSGTIASNLSYGNPGAGADRLMEAAEVAQARDFIEAKEAGIDTPISQGGTDVSGGQRQRLAIARALACDAKAFLFDDSFSALDYKTDTALRAALKEKLGGRTVIIVAQRISTIRNADNIVVLDEGRIAGQGTHDYLMGHCPEYREIAQSQLSEDELKGGVE